MACLSCPPFPSSPPIRLLYYLADVYQWQEIISKPKPCDPSSSCPDTACHARVNLCEGAAERERAHTYTHSHRLLYTPLEKPPALQSLIKSTHRSPITPVQGYLKSQDVYRLFPVLLTLLQGLQWGRKISPMR